MRLQAFAALLLAIAATDVQAQCQNSPLVTQTGASVGFQMVTMNRLGVASFAQAALQYRRGFRPGQPPFWTTTAPVPQVFNDRFSTSKTNQPFDIDKADQIALQITGTTTLQATITLLSHANGKSSFTLNCSPTGIVHGVTGDVEYLFYFGVIPPIQ